MARILVNGDDVVVRLSWCEKAAAGRGAVRVLRAAVFRVTVRGGAARRAHVTAYQASVATVMAWMRMLDSEDLIDVSPFWASAPAVIIGYKATRNWPLTRGQKLSQLATDRGAGPGLSMASPI